MSEPIKIALELDLGSNGGKWIFKSTAEIEAWLEKEKKAWSWVLDEANKDGTLQSVWQAQTDRWNELQESIRRVRQYAGTPDEKRFVDDLRTRLLQSYQVGRILHSASARAKHVDLIRQKEPATAGYVLAFYIGIQAGPSTKATRGAFLALAQEYGMYDAANTERAQLTDLQQSWQGFREESKKAFTGFQEQFTAVRKSIEEEQATHKVQFAKLVSDSTASADKALKNAQEQLTGLQKTYDEKMALQASVTYWKTKAASHRRLSFWFSGATVVAFGVVGFGLYKTLELIGGANKISDLQLWQVGLVVIVATVGVWVIRVLVRLLLSNVHLYTDGMERRTMLMTYLALLRRGQLPEGNERELILQALFRPSSTGIVKDDAAPPFMAEWLKRTTGVE